MIKIERDLDKIYRVLWLDDEKQIIESAYRALRTLPIDFIGVTHLSEAREILRSQKLALIISDQILPGGSGVEFLEEAKLIDPSITRVLLTGYLESPFLEGAVNRASVFRFISKPWGVDELRRDILQGLQHHDRSLQRHELLKEYTKQNRQLEDLTTSLERTVQERTYSEEVSKRHVEEGLQRLRLLTKFMKELSFCQNIEDFLETLSNEFRAFAEVRSLVVVHLAVDHQIRIIHKMGRQFIYGKASEAWPTSENELTHRQYLADRLKRPIGKILIYPSGSEVGGSIKTSFNIYIEHTLSDEAVSSFESFLNERIEPIRLTLDRLLLNEHLRSISFQWAKTFDGINDPIAIIDQQFEVLRGNSSFQEANDGPCYYRFAKRDSPCEDCPLLESLKTGESRKAFLKRGDRTFEVSSYPITTHTDLKSVTSVNYYKDVTFSRELQARLIQSEKMAAIGLLAGHIAHELNNPLTGLRSLSQIIAHEVSHDPNYQVLKSDLLEIEKASDRSQKIIQNLLQFSNSQPSHQIERIEINEIVQRTLPIVKTALREHNFQLLLTHEALAVEVEPHLIQQVLFNLVNNACQAMSETGSLSIKTWSEDSYCCLGVKDTGPGISPEVLSRIFDPFFTTKAEGLGTGLGLSMAQSTVAEFGGVIEVESEVGKGSFFIVKLPRSV